MKDKEHQSVGGGVWGGEKRLLAKKTEGDEERTFLEQLLRFIPITRKIILLHKFQFPSGNIHVHVSLVALGMKLGSIYKAYCHVKYSLRVSSEATYLPSNMDRQEMAKS